MEPPGDISGFVVRLGEVFVVRKNDSQQGRGFRTIRDGDVNLFVDPATELGFGANKDDQAAAFLEELQATVVRICVGVTTATGGDHFAGDTKKFTKLERETGIFSDMTDEDAFGWIVQCHELPNYAGHQQANETRTRRPE